MGFAQETSLRQKLIGYLDTRIHIKFEENEKELVDQQKNLSVGNETHNCFTIASKTIGGLKNVVEKNKN